MSSKLDILCEIAKDELKTDLKEKYLKICEKKLDIIKKFPRCKCISDVLYIKIKESGLLTNLDKFKSTIQNIDKDTDFIVCFFIIIRIGYKSNHCNIFIYDKSQNRVEKFEPNGFNVTQLYIMKKVDEEIYQKFEQIGIKYTKSEYFLPLNGPQCYDCTNDDIGYCTVWCILYLFLRIAFPEESLNDLIINMVKFIKNKPNKIENIVNFFHMFIKE